MSRLTDLSRELHALASGGMLYTKDRFDKERFERIRDIAAEILAMDVEGLPTEKAAELFTQNDGYQTPKCDTRAVIFNDRDEVLMIKDYDGKWALPGGWCDHDQTIFTNTIKEAYEEAGLDVEPYLLVAAHSHRKHNNPKSFFSVIRFFVLCNVRGGEFRANDETTECAYFAVDRLPEDINDHKSNPEQIRLCLEAKHADHWVTLFD